VQANVGNFPIYRVAKSGGGRELVYQSSSPALSIAFDDSYVFLGIQEPGMIVRVHKQTFDAVQIADGIDTLSEIAVDEQSVFATSFAKETVEKFALP
jgi:hypothetical protein